VQDMLPVAEAASGAQQADPQPPPAGGGKKEKERQRKERQRQRKIDEAKQGAIEAMLDGARCVNPLWLMCLARCTQVIGSRKQAGQVSLLAGCTHVSWECVWLQRGKRAGRGEGGDGGGREARGSQRAAGSAGGGGEDDMLERARAEQAERARATAAEVASAASAKAATEEAAAAERLQMEKEMAALAVTVQSDALRLQQMQAQLGVPPAAPAPHPDEDQCVLCLDAPTDHLIFPCGHQCVCGEAEGGQPCSVPLLPHTHHRHLQGVCRLRAN
jgi:hypothetical protein